MKKFLKWPVLALVVLLFAFRSELTESREASFAESCETSFEESRAASFEESCLASFEESFETSFAESWSDSLIKTLTLDQKIGQLFMVAAWSDEKKESYNPTQIETLIKNNGIGGIIFFQGGPVRQAKLTNRFQSKSKIPLLIGIDAEWGLGMRLDSTISFPRAMTLGASMDEKLIYEFGKEVARQCKRIGVHMNFAPVVDVNSNPKNPVISNRSFGENADRVTTCGMAYMKGMQENGVLANAKHFPGHGDTDADSHKELPVVNKNYAQLSSNEFKPYRTMFENGLASVMVAHLSLPEFEKEAHVPSTLSKNIITGLLRDSLKFEGLVLTDAMNMEGVAKYFPAGEADVRALIAGNDVVLFPLNVPLAIQKVKEAIQQGRITEAEITAKALKVLKAKERVGAHKFKPIQIKGISKDLNLPYATALRRRCIESSITVISENKIPYEDSDKWQKPLGIVVVGDDVNCAFAKSVDQYKAVEIHSLGKECSDTEIQAVIAKMKDNCTDVLVAFLGTTNKAGSNFGITSNGTRAAEKIAEHFTTTVVMFACPYALEKSEWKGVNSFVVAYQPDDLTQQVTADAICGVIPFQGKLPVSVGTKFKEGQGKVFQTAGRMRYLKPSQTGWFNFVTSSAQTNGNSSVYVEDMMANAPTDVAGTELNLFSKVDDIVKEGLDQGAYPGCRVLIAKEGVILYNKSFGYLDKAKTQKVSESSIYDLASVTKMLSTTMALMKLVDEGKIDVEKCIGDYIEFPAGHPHAKMQLKRMLSHTAGLPAWKDFTNLTVKGGEWDGNCLSKEHTDKCSNPVCADMWTTKEMTDSIYKEILEVKLNPDQGYLYSDLGYYYYKKMIEKITGMPLDFYVSESFYKPMGLRSMGYNPQSNWPVKMIAETETDTKWRRQAVRGYVHDQGAALLGGVAGHAGLFGNANDCAALMQMCLNDGRYGANEFFHHETMDLFTARHFKDNRRGLGFDKPGFGKWTGATGPSASDESFGHSGFTGTLCWADPANGTVFVFLSNRNCPSSENWKINDLRIRPRIHEEIYKLFPVKP
jgi:beta-glucosidase-like glycosyl hydrolase/CubicO group peptidase (beta-lactamase class C family)